MLFTRRGFALGGTALVLQARAQMLSRPGWRGTGMAPEAWWKHATFVRFGADATFAGAVKALDTMSQVGADSLILPDLQPVAATATSAAMPFAPAFGSEAELDDLLREASARRMHVLLRAPLGRLVGSPGEVRFWMSRGIAGFDMGTLGGDDGAAVAALRASLDHFAGQRILMARVPGDVVLAGRKGASRDAVTLRVVLGTDVLSGAAGHSAQPQVVEVVADEAGPAVEAGSAAAALPAAVPALQSLLPLLLASGAPVLDSRLLATEAERAALVAALNLRNTHAVLRTGTVAVVPAGLPLRAWLLQGRERAGRQNLLLVENTGSAEETLHLTDAVAKAGVRGLYLRPLLRSDGAMGSLDLERGVLPPGAAVLAEVHGSGG